MKVVPYRTGQKPEKFDLVRCEVDHKKTIRFGQECIVQHVDEYDGSIHSGIVVYDPQSFSLVTRGFVPTPENSEGGGRSADSPAGTIGAPLTPRYPADHAPALV